MKVVAATVLLAWLCPSLADTLYINAGIYTANPEVPQAEALYVVGGKIAFVGSEVEALTQVNDKTDLVDLTGHTVIPGFIEGHGHIMGMGFAKLSLDLMDVANYEGLLEKGYWRRSRLQWTMRRLVNGSSGVVGTRVNGYPNPAKW